MQHISQQITKLLYCVIQKQYVLIGVSCTGRRGRVGCLVSEQCNEQML